MKFYKEEPASELLIEFTNLEEGEQFISLLKDFGISGDDFLIRVERSLPSQPDIDDWVDTMYIVSREMMAKGEVSSNFYLDYNNSAFTEPVFKLYLKEASPKVKTLLNKCLRILEQGGNYKHTYNGNTPTSMLSRIVTNILVMATRKHSGFYTLEEMDAVLLEKADDLFEEAEKWAALK